METTARIRSEQPGDVDAIRKVLAACFPTPAEAGLVDALRAAGRLVVSMVALDGERIVGHVAFSPVVAEASQSGGVGLAPLSVLESHRCRGIGAALAQAGLRACRDAGWGWAVVLGEPEYYGRFGFVPASRFGLTSEYDAGDAFQAMELVAGRLAGEGGLVRYSEEFGEV